jgi:hypothetical protein
MSTNLLATLIASANDAAAIAATHGQAITDKATLVNALSALSRLGYAEEGSATEAFMQEVIGSIDTDAATEARNAAIAMHTAAKNYAAATITDADERSKALATLKSPVSGKDEKGDNVVRTRAPKGYTYSIDDNVFANVAELAASLNRPAAYVREPLLEAFANVEDDETFTFTVDGTEVTASK